MKKITCIFLVLAIQVSSSFCVAEKMKISTLQPSNPDYQSIHDEFKSQGEITRIISADTSGGLYFFVFVEQHLKTEVHKGMETTLYGVMKDESWGEVKKIKEDDITYTIKNLRAYVLLADHGGYTERQKFQDFGNEVYWPVFIYDDCFIQDVDRNGDPEFYLTYFGQSDGLDAKPLKVIVYDSHQMKGGKYIKAKTTAWYPAGNEDDKYRIEYDEAWLALPDVIKNKTNEILKKNYASEQYSQN